MLYDRLRLRDIRNTSTFRLTMLLGLVFAAGVAALLGLIYLLTAAELSARSDHILQLEAARMRTVDPDALPGAISFEIAHSASRLNYFALRAQDGRDIVSNISIPPGFRIDDPEDVAPVAGGPRSVRILAIRIGRGETLFIGRDILPIIDLQQRVLKILIGSGIAIALLVLAAGVALSIAPLRRVRDLQRASREIAAGDLSTRIPLLGRGDELDLFAGTVNVMVEEVAHVVAQVKEVTDVIAHDLRAPLARVRQQLAKARHARENDPELDAVFATSLVDLNLVLDRFSALLRIAELEASRRRAGFGDIALTTLIAEIAELYAPLAEDRPVALTHHADEDLVIHGDEHLILEAVSNLVDNAIKFTPAGGHIFLSARSGTHGPVIEVRDDGPGIPANEREPALRRFHRGRNATNIPGLGIGLSAVMAIVHMHGFTIELDDAMPGLIVRIHCRTQPAQQLG